MKKRMLSWLLALTMLLTLAPQALPVWASAAESTNGTDTQSQTESNKKFSAYSALGLSQEVDDTEKPKEQPYGKAEEGNTIATNVINELYVNFNGSIHYGWSILDDMSMEYDGNSGALGYWRPNPKNTSNPSKWSANTTKSALFAENGTEGNYITNGNVDTAKVKGNKINSNNKHLTNQYSKSEAFSPNTGKDNYVAEMVLDSDNNVKLYIYPVDGGTKSANAIASAKVITDKYAGTRENTIYNYEYDAMYDIAAGDMDGDGYDELAVYASNAVYLYSFQGTTLKQVTKVDTIKPNIADNDANETSSLRTAIVTLAFGDLNADDKDELVIAENMTYQSQNIADGKVEIYTLKGSTLSISLQTTAEEAKNVNSSYTDGPYVIRYANVAVGDIDGDYKDELIIAGYFSGSNKTSLCNTGTVHWKVVKYADDAYNQSGWNKQNLPNSSVFGRVVDNKGQSIPPVSLACAATQGVGYADQLFMAGALYSVTDDSTTSTDETTKKATTTYAYSLTELTTISDERDYKKDNGDSTDKEEVFVVNVIAGNFNGNQYGQEQIVYAYGVKRESSDEYWYAIGYINKKEPGDTNDTSDDGYWKGRELVMNCESSYNSDKNKSRASLYLSLAAVDCDKDSTLMQYKGRSVTWTAPEVLTVLQSAPYFQDLEDTRGYLNQGQTSYGKSTSSGTSVTAGGSLSVGYYVSFEQDFSVFGVKVASVEAEAQTKHSFTYAYEGSTTITKEISYSGSAGDDYVIVYAVPYMEYTYETFIPGYTLPTDEEEYNRYLDNYLEDEFGETEWDSFSTDRKASERSALETKLGLKKGLKVEDSWQPTSVMVPMTPRTVMLTVDDYDAIAEETGLTCIRNKILYSTPGDPTTYDKIGENDARSSDFKAIEQTQTVTNAEGSNISVTYAVEESQEHSFEYSYEFEGKAGAGAGGVTVGVLAGYGVSAGGSLSSSTGTTYSATVDNLPADATKYGFSWQFGWREASINGDDILVLEYRVGDVATMPSPPKNLRVESVTSDSVTLSWDPVTGAGAYKIYQVEKSTGKLFLMKTLPGTAISWTNEKLGSNTSYIYVAQTVMQSGETSITSNQVNASTLEKNGDFEIIEQPKLTAETYPNGDVILSVKAEYRNEDGTLNDLHYEWQVYNKETKDWEASTGGTKASYTVNVKEENDGDKYRCLVYSTASLYLYSKEVTLKVGKASSTTSLTSSSFGTTVKSSYFKENVANTTVTTEVPVTENGYTKYSYGTNKYVYEKNGSYYLTANENATQLTKTTTYDLYFNGSHYEINEPSFTAVESGIVLQFIGKDQTYTATNVSTVTVSQAPIQLCRCGTQSDGYFYFVTQSGSQYEASLTTVNKLQVDSNTLIELSELEVVTDSKQETVETTTQEYTNGDTVTLTATVAEGSSSSAKTPSGTVTFKAINTTSGGNFTVSATVDENGTATATWKPVSSGVYRVTAVYNGDDMFKASESESYTITVVTPNEKKLVVSGENMTYGESQELTAMLFNSTGTSTVKPGYVVTCDGKAMNDVINENGIFTPTKAGTYTITATYTDDATNEPLQVIKVINVYQKTVTITPKVEDSDGEKQATYTLDGVLDADKRLFSGNVTVTCDGTKANAAAGEYGYVITFNSTADIESKYNVLLDTQTKYVLDDSVVYVTNATTSSNGSVILSYTYKGETFDVSGTGGSGNIPKGATLTATAVPNVGYRVEKWTKNGNPVYSSNNVYNTTTVYELENVQEACSIKADFTQVYYDLTLGFATGGTGTIVAKYLTDTGTEGDLFYSSASPSTTPTTAAKQLSPLQKVRITATPEEGKVISGWRIYSGSNDTTGTLVKNDYGTIYTGNTYTVSSISADTRIFVETEATAEQSIYVTLENQNGDTLSDDVASVSFNGVTTQLSDGKYTYSGSKHDNVTITLTIPDSLIVDSWKEGDTELNVGTLSSNKKTLSLSDLQENLNLTVICKAPNSYHVNVTQGLAGKDTKEPYGNIDITKNGTTAKVTDTVLDATVLRVVIEPTDGYELLSVTYNGQTQTTEKTTQGDAFTINGVHDDVNIVANFVKKPVVTVAGNAEQGAVTVTGTVNGVENTTVSSGGYVDYNTPVKVTVTPAKEYEVTALKKGDDNCVLGSTTTDAKTAETSSLTKDITLTPTIEEIPHKNVTISVVDQNDSAEGGFYGSVTASVARKNMDAYEETGTADAETSTQTLTVYRDSTVALSAQPKEGYVAKWIYNDEESLTPPTLDFSASATLQDYNVQVRFDPIGNKITFAKTGEDSSDVAATFMPNDGDEVTFESGNIPNTDGILKLTVTPDDGYEVEGWYVNGVKQDDSAEQDTFEYSVTHGVGAAIEVKIIRSSYEVNFSAVNGTITATPSISADKMVVGDTSVTFTATPAQTTGYTFAGWKINDKTPNEYNDATEDENGTLTVTIKEPVTVTATYTQDVTRHTVTYGVNGETLGTLTTNLSTSPATIANGNTARFTATPKDGNYVEGWYSDADCTQKISGTGEETSYSVDVYSDTAVYVKFAVKPTYKISLTKNGSGTVFASINDGAETEVTEDTLAVKYHDKVVFRAQAGKDHYFAGWQDNTKDTYTIADATENASVTATFAPTQSVYLKASSTDTSKGTLTATGSVTGTITTNTDGNGVLVAGGEQITLTAHPENNQMVKAWKIGDTVQSDNLSNTLVIDSITENTTVTVEFEEYVGYTIPTTPTTGSGYKVTDVHRIPDDTPKDGKIRKGGTVTFMVIPDDDKVFSELKVGDVDCLSTPSTDKVTVVRKGNGYEITISNVIEAIDLTATAIQFRVIETELTQVPEGLGEKYATPAAMKSELRTNINSSVSGSNIKYLDIKLQINTGDGWEDVTAANFPKGGIDITILYNKLGSDLDKSYNYSVAHMLANGTVENLAVTNEKDGITFHVNSLSPFAIGWYKFTGGTGGGGGGGGGAVSTYTLTFETNGGNAIDKVTKDSGTTIDLAAYKPTRAGYTFAGWFSDKELTKAVTSVKLTTNTTVYAKWTQDGGTVQNPFVDVKEGAYYYDAVLWAVDQKITSGTSATTFSPDASCTRAQMVTFLWRAAGSPKAENTKNPFTDVKADAYYYDAVLWAVEKGVTSGTSATTFSPDATVTRGQTVTFLYRNAGSPDVTGTMPFTDVEADAYYAKAVLWAVQQKITTGTSETTFSPANDCTRGQIVTFLYRAK